MTYILAVLLALAAFVAWQAMRLIERRRAVRRRDRMQRSIAKQKVWDMVFGRRLQRRLSFDQRERSEE